MPDPDDLIGRSVLDFVNEADRRGIDARAGSVQETGIAVPTAEVRLTRADKKSVVFEVTSMQLVVDGMWMVRGKETFF